MTLLIEAHKPVMAVVRDFLSRGQWHWPTDGSARPHILWYSSQSASQQISRCQPASDNHLQLLLWEIRAAATPAASQTPIWREGYSLVFLCANRNSGRPTKCTLPSPPVNSIRLLKNFFREWVNIRLGVESKVPSVPPPPCRQHITKL
jgi:hypothetical protein